MPAAAGDPPLVRSRFLLALIVAASFVLSAPFIGEVRHWIRDAFPGHFVAIVGAGVALGVAIAVLLAARRLFSDTRGGSRAWRAGLVFAAITLAVVYSLRSAIGNPESDVVEHVHFLEYGLITWLFYRAWRPLGDSGSLVLPVLAGLIVGTCEEWFQWFIPARVGEMRDVFLNLAAIVSGLLFSVALDPIPDMRGRPRARSVVQITLVAAAAAVAFALFLQSAHVGYEIRDPEAGTFRSIFTGDELLALSRARAAEWATSPPLQRPARLGREDQYASEGLLHVQERNRQWDAQRPDAAWQENLILEKYFAPVLDAPSYLTRTGHRWPPPQRADAAQRASGTARDTGFVSHAQGDFPIFLWRRQTMWSVVALVVVLLLAVARRSAAR